MTKESGDAKAVGRRFSHNYLGGGAPVRDSQRLRVRIASLIANEKLRWDDDEALAAYLQSELGVPVTIDYQKFFTKADIADVLDSITLVWRWAKAQKFIVFKKWPEGAARILQEENAGYKLDGECGVLFFADQEFQALNSSVIAALSLPRYKAAREMFSAAQIAFDSHPPDGRTAIRDTFEAVEIVFKLYFPAASRLGSSELTQYLKPIVQNVYAGNAPALNAAGLQLKAFSEWTNAAHQYRHGQAVEEPAPPPLDFAVTMVSSGGSYLRWLVSVGTSAGL